MQSNYSEFQKFDAIILAISTDAINNSKRTKEEFDIHYHLLSDPEAEVIRAYGVYSWEEGIAFPATFIIDKEGIIRWQSPVIGEREYSDTILGELENIAK